MSTFSWKIVGSTFIDSKIKVAFDIGNGSISEGYE